MHRNIFLFLVSVDSLLANTVFNRHLCDHVLQLNCCLGYDNHTVCGSNGVTYYNDCEFAKGLCAQPDKHVVAVHAGKCLPLLSSVQPNTPTIQMTTFPAKSTTENFGSILERFFCSEREVNCEHIKDYVCADDGLTYRTRCDFAKAHCDFPKLNIKHSGPCSGTNFFVEYRNHKKIHHTYTGVLPG